MGGRRAVGPTHPGGKHEYCLPNGVGRDWIEGLTRSTDSATQDNFALERQNRRKVTSRNVIRCRPKLSQCNSPYTIEDGTATPRKVLP
jgi:hypothetical protein